MLPWMLDVCAGARWIQPRRVAALTVFVDSNGGAERTEWPFRSIGQEL